MRRPVPLSLTKWKCICQNVFLQHFFFFFKLKMKYFSIPWNWNVSLGFTDLTGSILFDIGSMIICFCFFFFSHCHLETAVVPRLLVSLSPLVRVLWLHCPSRNSIKALCYLHPCAFSKLSSFILALKFTPKRSYPLKKLLDERPQEISSNINFPMILQLKVCVRVLLLLQIW